ncbi:cell surface hydrolase [Lactobacillus selangorensis]|uniref:Cell surface hydrolase n=1 Tax=Lactobacillus selangorensis TaxID=81857 RepID=A0A0R2FSJ6_9LACO|nr:alpha/beta hydrolase [Lactobacillus selangorensis]KRN28391.1 cell surface hydrolase [Lactobacillus selangorensis]KRN31892.1 cell surface hydrolase [Lactobacillus selangorensis]
MHSKSLTRFLLLFAAVLVGSVLLAAPVQAAKKKTITPTLYIHGFKGSAASMNSMIVIAQDDAKAGTKIATATVDASGNVAWTETAGVNIKKVKHPIIQVVLTENTMPVDTQAQWIQNVLVSMKKKYHYTTYNAVCHSAGCVATVENAMKNGRKKATPKLKKLVTIAGPFDGVLGMGDTANTTKLDKNGKPSVVVESADYPSYTELESLRKGFPKGVKVLNLYGNLNDGTNSDGQVTNASALSLKYLLRGETKSYQVKEFTGANAYHTKLHENAAVDKAVIKFIWHKNLNYKGQ